MRLEVPGRAKARLGTRRGNTGNSSRQPEHQEIVGSAFSVCLVAGRKGAVLLGLIFLEKG